jgi:hypothetical protein
MPKRKKKKQFGMPETMKLLQKVSRLSGKDRDDYRDNIFACFHADRVWWDLLESIDEEVTLSLSILEGKVSIPLFDKEASEDWCDPCDNPIKCCTCAA